jgi:hypothetical protein
MIFWGRFLIKTTKQKKKMKITGGSLHKKQAQRANTFIKYRPKGPLHSERTGLKDQYVEKVRSEGP